MRIASAHISVILLCLVCFYNALDGNFVFDDTVAILKNKDVSGPSSGLQAIFGHDFWGDNITSPASHKSYRPLTTLMFRLEYGYFNMRSLGMKTINLIIHCLNSCLLLEFFLTVTNKLEISLIGAGLFAVHPVHTEAVSGIVGRAELMFGLCFLMSLLIYSSINTRKQSILSLIFRYFGLVVLSAAGLLFKENAISILPSCICYDIIMRTNLLQKGNNRLFVKKVVLARCAFLLLLTIILLVARLYVQNFESPKFKEMDNPIGFIDDFFSKFLSQSYLYVLNCWLLLCTEWMSFDWAMDCVPIIETLLDFRCLFVALFYAIVYLLFIRRLRLISLALAMLTVTFLPASGIIRVGFVIAERVLYVPSMGFCLLIALGFKGFVDYFKKLKKILYVLLFIVIVISVSRTRQKAAEWTTEDVLFESALKVCPNNAKVHYNIARTATDLQQTSKALEYYHNAIRLYPKYEAALMNLGNIYREIGDYQTAEEYLKLSIEALEEFPSAWMNLGIVQAAQKKYEEALHSYNKALSYKSRYPNCLYNMGNLFLDLKNYSMAMKHWQESVALNPKHQNAWANMLALLDNQGLYEDVVRLSDRAISFVPNSASVLFIRANVLGKLKQYPQAEKIYFRIIKEHPKNALYHSNLGVLYHRWGKKDLAVQSYMVALKLDENLKSAKTNLEKLLKS